MKISVVIAGERAPDNAFVVWRGFEASIRKANRLGYDGVELALGAADDVNVAKIDQWLQEEGLCVSCISTGLTYAQRGLYMTHPDGEKRDEVVAVFEGLVHLAQHYGGLVNVGRARGFVAPGQSREEAETLFLGCMKRILPEAEKRDVTIMIEPVNRYESNFINSLDDAAALISRLESPNVGIMADVFHMNIEDDSIPGALMRNRDYVKYVHMADSNRKAPGQGHTDFPAIIETLRKINYDGWLGVEILPGHNPDDRADTALRFIQALL